MQVVSFSAYHGGYLKTRKTSDVLAVHEDHQEIPAGEEKHIYGEVRH